MATQWSEKTVQIAHAAPLRLRVHRNAAPDAPLVVHLHGGAFTESLDPERAVATLLAESGASVIAVDYPVGPDYPFPCALQAIHQVLHWTHRSSGLGKNRRLLVAGEEAGGNLAAAVALMARDLGGPRLAGQILLSPMLDPCLATKSIRQADAGPVGCKWADGWHQYLGSADKASHPYASPLGSSRLAGLPAALVLTADDDPMRDESLAYVQRLRDSGVTVEEHVLPAPTLWPNALHRLESPPPPWAAVVRDLFAAFFAGTAAPCPVIAPHSVRT